MTLDADTLISVKTIVAILIPMLVTSWTVSRKLSAIEAKIDSQWSRNDQARWVDKLRDNNKTLNVPTVYEHN